MNYNQHSFLCRHSDDVVDLMHGLIDLKLSNEALTMINQAALISVPHLFNQDISVMQERLYNKERAKVFARF